MDTTRIGEWRIKENTFSRFYMNFYAEIIRLDNNFQLTVIGSDRKRYNFCFNTLEDAFIFSDNVVRNSYTISEVLDIYGNKELIKKW